MLTRLAVEEVVAFGKTRATTFVYLASVVEDYAERLAMARADATHTVTKIHAIDVLRALDGTLINCEDNTIALAQWHDHGPRLHARPLFGQHKVAASEVSLRFR